MMTIDVVTNIIIFLATFAALSIVELTFSFIRAVFSNPPKKFEISKNALIYYGICISYLVTILTNI